MPDGKKRAAKAASKAKLKKEKKQKAAASAEHKAKKSLKKSKDYVHTQEDIEETLAAYREKWEAEHKVTAETVGGPPSRRVNATFVACPNSTSLWLFGGEWLEADDRCHFYNNLYRFNPDKNEWRLYTSPNSPGPRSAHQLVATAAGGGKLWLFGGEFAALNQSAFHHYRDLWCFDVATTSWERLETRVRPSARSGHRMCVWKHFLVLFGGFHDAGVRTQYLGDLWLFDTQRYEWKEIIVRDVERKPCPRSGFSFLTAAEGLVLHGGFRKDYIGKRAIGVPLDDTWLLKLDTDNLANSKWERRKRGGYAPSLRCGTTMTVWSARSLGVLFGGVHDEDKDEESMESVFFDDLYGYQLNAGRWSSLQIRKKKRKIGKVKPTMPSTDYDGDTDMQDADETHLTDEVATERPAPFPDAEDIPPAPRARYNAMLAIQRNILYLYGGILETQSREAALDDFWQLDLAKLDEWKCLREAEIEWEKGDSDDDARPSSDEESGYSSIEEDGPDEPVPMQVEQTAALEPSEREREELRKRADAFVAASKVERSEEDRNSTPLPGESLKLFYERTREYWAMKAHQHSDNRGKLLRRDGFQLADERYEAYRPLLLEIERIQAAAGLDESEIAGATSMAVLGAARNRR